MRYVVIVFAAAAIAAQAQGIYGGPSMGGRRLAGERTGATTGFEFWGGISGDADTGLAVPRTDASGGIVSAGVIESLRANFGIQGVHRTRHSTYGLAYIGSFTKSNSEYLSGSEHALAFDSSTQFTRRVIWQTSTRAGSMTRPFGSLYSYAGLNNGEDLTGVLNQPLTSRFYFGQHEQTLTFRMTAHTEIMGGGSVFKIVREGNLYNALGYGGQGGIAHQISARTGVGLQYQFLHYDFGRAYGGSDVQIVMAQLQRRLSARWALRAGLGGLKTNLQGERVVTPDPIVVALFGNLPFIETFASTKYTPAFTLDLAGRFAHWSMTIRASRQATPGNGIIRTSISEGGTAGLSYTGIRHWTFGASGGYQRLIALEENLANNSTAVAGAGFGYYIGRNLSLNARADYRKYLISRTGAFRNEGSRVSVGLTYHSREHPISFW